MCTPHSNLKKKQIENVPNWFDNVVEILLTVHWAADDSVGRRRCRCIREGQRCKYPNDEDRSYSGPVHPRVTSMPRLQWGDNRELPWRISHAECRVREVSPN